VAEVLTYEALREVQRNERKSEKLTDLKPDFYRSIESYLKRIEKTGTSDVELRNARSILQDVKERRERKVMNQALLVARTGTKVDTNTMTTKEKTFYSKIITALCEYRDVKIPSVKKKNAKKEPKKSAEKKNEDVVTYIKVKILEELPEIVGSDLESYGPFKAGDIVKLPSENAQIFMEKGKAEKK